MAACAACRADNPAGARFCASCGASLGAGCPRCGGDLPPEARFCPSCGLAVATEPRVEERKLVTVLFADVIGSTQLGERLDPERLREVMGSYFEAMRDEIQAEGGTVEKFVGDAVMAVFGAPAAHEDDPARALRAALRMQRRLEELNEGIHTSHGVRLEMRVGVNTGEVLASLDPRPGEGLVTGDAVNVASRLEEAAEPGQVVVGERTARAARGFRFRSMGPLELKGKSVPVAAYLLQPEEVPPAPEPVRGVPGLRAPLVGRDAEMALLTSLYDRVAQERRPHLVTVLGDPGVGKSRLVGEFVAWAEAHPASPIVLRGRALPYGEAVTYWPLAEVLKSLAGILETDPPGVALDKIRKLGRDLLTPAFAPDPVRATAALAYTIGVEDPEVPFADLPPRQVRLEIHAAWRAFLSALGADRPVLAVVEDIHWADQALLDLLQELGDRAQGGILMVCAARPELTARRPDWGGGRRSYSSILLDPLSEEDSARLVSLLLDLDEPAEHVRRQMLERAEGNPFFLEEIIRHLIDEGRIVLQDGRWRATGDVGEVAIPDTVQAVLAARIDLLEQADKRALQMAAVVGRVFWSGTVAHLVGEDGVDEALDRLESRDLVLRRLGTSMAEQREYIFKHALTRDVAYETLPRRERADAHARVARWIEEAMGERRGEHAEVLAHHFVEAHRGPAEDPSADRAAGAGLREAAFRYLLLAAESARRKLVLAKAQRLAEEALSLAESVQERALALEAAGQAHNNDYQGDQAWRYLSAAVDARLEGIPEDRRAIARLCALAVEVPTRWPGSMKDVPEEAEVRRYLDVGLAHVGDQDSPELVGLLVARALWPWSFRRQEPVDEEELREAVEAGERAQEMAMRLGRPALASAALDALGANYTSLGRYGEAMVAVERRLELAPQLEDPWELGDIYAVASWSLFYMGDYPRAARVADEGLALLPAEAEGMALHVTAWRALARFRLGDWEGFLLDLARIQEILGERSGEPPYYAARPFAAAVLIHEVQGNRAAADRYLEIVRRLDERQGRPKASSRHPWVAMALTRRREFEQARELLWAPVFDTWKEDFPLVAEARCELVAAQEDWARAPKVVLEARRFADETGVRSLPLFADRLEGRMAVARKENAKATRLLGRAATGFAELEARWEEACTELWLAEALLRSREKDAARERVEHALPVLERLSSVRELVHARDLLARTA